MTYRIRMLGIAVALAVLAGLLTLYYVTSYKHRVDSRQQHVPVVVAAHDIPAGTTGAVVVAKHLVEVEQVSRGAVVPGAISQPSEIAKLVAVQATYAGEQVSARRFGPLAAEGIRSQLTGTSRAIQVAGNANQLLAGVLKAGDHVDVVANVKYPDEGSQKHFTRVVVRDLLVLRTSGAPSGTSKITSGPNGDSWVILRATDTQSQKVFFAYANEDWSLELRPGLNDADSPGSLADANSVLRVGLGASGSAALAGVNGGKP